MSSRIREERTDAREEQDDRTPLLGASNDIRARQDRGTLPMWRHVLENKMTWALYNSVIGSGAISLLIYNLPYRIHGLWIFGAIIYVLSLILFLVMVLVHVVRFLVRPSLVPRSIKHPVEGYYVASMPAALGILILSGATYAHKMHGYNDYALRTFYWIFIVLSLVSSIGSPLVQFAKGAQNRADKSFAPASLTPSLPLLLAGPTAATVLARLPANSHHSAVLGIIAFGVILQGMGVFLSSLYQSSILNRLHTEGFPHPRERPALFLASIPPALSAWASTALAQQALRHFPPSTAPGGAPDLIVGGVALYYVGVTLGLVFWGAALWWFVIAAMGCVEGWYAIAQDGGGQALDWFIVVFAHVAFFMGSNELLRAFAWPKGLTVLNEILGVITIVVWAVLFLACTMGVVTGRFTRD